MRSKSVLSRVVTVLVLVLGGSGGSTGSHRDRRIDQILITHGISMEPLLHTGDLVLIAPVDNYRVGQVVAYHSTLLHTIVLHRISSGRHYFFKGENNDFIDPRMQRGRCWSAGMWLHIPRGGVVLCGSRTPRWPPCDWLCRRCSCCSAGRTRRRRDRRRHTSAARPARKESGP